VEFYLGMGNFLEKEDVGKKGGIIFQYTQNHGSDKCPVSAFVTRELLVCIKSSIFLGYHLIAAISLGWRLHHSRAGMLLGMIFGKCGL